MTEVWFYHLTTQPLATALPAVLEKALARGWRVVVEVPDEVRLKALDDALWTNAPESFLPHGTIRDRNAGRQPVLLTDEPDDSGAGGDGAGDEATGADGADAAGAFDMRLYVGGAVVHLDPATAPYRRVVLMFDGRDEAELADARRQWSRLKAQGFVLAYWQQGAEGRWEKRM